MTGKVNVGAHFFAQVLGCVSGFEERPVHLQIRQ